MFYTNEVVPSLCALDACRKNSVCKVTETSSIAVRRSGRLSRPPRRFRHCPHLADRFSKRIDRSLAIKVCKGVGFGKRMGCVCMKQPSSTMLPEILSDGPVKICRSDKDNLTLPAVTEVVMRTFTKELCVL